MESRFDKLAGKLSHEKGITDPKALAASIGRKKYGEKGMVKLEKKGEKRKRDLARKIT